MSAWPLPNPDLFSPPINHVSLGLDADDIEGWSKFFADITLPEALNKAVPKRQAEFLAGRYCARQALARAAEGRAPFEALVPTRADRAPAWPEGYVGSITHTKGFVAAAAARADDVRSIGLDSEHVMTAETAENVRSMVALEGELAALAGSGLDPTRLLTLVFSAKETLYKCLHPLVGRFFGFHEARLTSVDLEGRRYHIELVGGLSDEFRDGARFGGRFAFDHGLVHTGMALAARGGAGPENDGGGA